MCATPSVGGMSNELSLAVSVTWGAVTIDHCGSPVTRSSTSMPNGHPAGCSTGWSVHAVRYSSTLSCTRSTNAGVGWASTVTGTCSAASATTDTWAASSRVESYSNV